MCPTPILKVKFPFKQIYMISIIVAISEDYGIGKGNELLWHIPDDLKYFKKVTMGCPVIMGKRTWYSLPKRPLPGRRNIVLTDMAGETFDGAETVYSIDEALGKSDKNGEFFIIGGGSVYRQFMPYAGRLYITMVHKTTDADVYFPEIKSNEWKVISEEPHLDCEIPHTYIVYERI